MFVTAAEIKWQNSYDFVATCEREFKASSDSQRKE